MASFGGGRSDRSALPGAESTGAAENAGAISYNTFGVPRTTPPNTANQVMPFQQFVNLTNPAARDNGPSQGRRNAWDQGGRGTFDMHHRISPTTMSQEFSEAGPHIFGTGGHYDPAPHNPASIFHHDFPNTGIQHGHPTMPPNTPTAQGHSATNMARPSGFSSFSHRQPRVMASQQAPNRTIPVEGVFPHNKVVHYITFNPMMNYDQQITPQQIAHLIADQNLEVSRRNYTPEDHIGPMFNPFLLMSYPGITGLSPMGVLVADQSQHQLDAVSRTIPTCNLAMADMIMMKDRDVIGTLESAEKRTGLAKEEAKKARQDAHEARQDAQKARQETQKVRHGLELARQVAEAAEVTAGYAKEHRDMTVTRCQELEARFDGLEREIKTLRNNHLRNRNELMRMRQLERENQRLRNPNNTPTQPQQQMIQAPATFPAIRPNPPRIPNSAFARSDPQQAHEKLLRRSPIRPDPEDDVFAPTPPVPSQQQKPITVFTVPPKPLFGQRPTGMLMRGGGAPRMVFGQRPPVAAAAVPPKPKPLFEIKPLDVMLTQGHDKIQDWVFKWCVVGMPLGATKFGAPKLIQLAVDQLDSRKMAAMMLEEPFSRPYLLVGVVSFLLSQLVFTPPLLSEIVEEETVDFNAAWAEEQRLIIDFNGATDYSQRNAAALRRAHEAHTLAQASDFWLAAKEFSDTIASQIFEALRAVISPTTAKDSYGEFKDAIFDIVKVAVRMRQSARMYRTEFHRYGDRWDFDTMEQRNPNMKGEPCNELPPIWCVRSTMTPEYIERDFTGGVNVDRLLLKARVLICDRKKNLR